MASDLKILLLDDDPKALDLYRELLGQHLPSLPEVKTASNATRALAMLEADAYSMLISDLDMPRIDGLQVMSIARRKYPQMRLVALTGLRDEQFRSRAYAMGVDQYWIKPENEQQMGMFMEAIESLLHREIEGGFRGVQSKSLVDIIQLECLSQSTSLLKITHSAAQGLIWIHNGDVIDAEALGLTSEAAFHKILTWKMGSFEILPGDASRPRTIFTSYQGLLLNTAQAMDEDASIQAVVQKAGDAAPVDISMRLAEFAQCDGVEFILAHETKRDGKLHCWGMDNPKTAGDWMLETMKSLQELGEILQVGHLQLAFGDGPLRKVALASSGQFNLSVGFAPSQKAEQMRDTMKTILTRWAS